MEKDFVFEKLLNLESSLVEFNIFFDLLKDICDNADLSDSCAPKIDLLCELFENKRKIIFEEIDVIYQNL